MSAFLLPDLSRAASGEGSVGIAIFVPAIAQEDGEEPSTDETSAESDVESESTTTPEAEASPEDEEAAKLKATLEEQAAPMGSGELNYTINSLIMFLCAVLVLFMQAGFSMVEAGLNQAKNVVNILFKNLMDLSVGVILFLFIGYGLMYPASEMIPGWFGYGGPDLTMSGGGPDENGVWGDYSPSADFIFQAAFAATAATIVSGAVAGRMKFTAYLIYSAVLTGLIYPISGMWKWGGGQLADWGFQDFAGSVVVHAVGGFAGLAGAIVLGARKGRFNDAGKSVPIPGHNLTFAALGVMILWIGWYGFNPGSQLTYSGGANAHATAYIAVSTTMAAAAGAIVAMLLSWVLFRKPDLTMALNGALAGLVGITANCDQVSEISALIIGAVAGGLVVGSVLLLDKLKIDDPVGAFPVHGVCGVWGGIATGFFGANLPTIELADGTEKTLSRMEYILVQCQSTLIICVWAFVTMFALFMILKVVGLLRVSPEEEQQGLDICEHGLEAYPRLPTIS